MFLVVAGIVTRKQNTLDFDVYLGLARKKMTIIDFHKIFPMALESKYHVQKITINYGPQFSKKNHRRFPGAHFQPVLQSLQP